MSQDGEQNRRLDRIEGDVAELKAEVGTLGTNQALVTQSIGNLEKQFGTGMSDLKDELQAARKSEAVERAATREAEREDADRQLKIGKQNADRRERLLMKVFGLIGAVIAVAGAAVTGGAYFGMQVEPPPAPVEVAAPVTAPH